MCGVNSLITTIILHDRIQYKNGFGKFWCNISDVNKKSFLIFWTYFYSNTILYSSCRPTMKVEEGNNTVLFYVLNK